MLSLLILSLPIGASFFLGSTPKEQHVGGGYRVPEIYLTHFWVFALYGLWLFDLATKKARTVKLNKCDLAAFGLICWSSLSFFSSLDLKYSLSELLKMLLPFLIYFYIAHNVKTKEEVKQIICLLLVGVFIQSLVAFYQVNFGQNRLLRILAKMDFPTMKYLGMEVPRVGGTIGWPVIFVQYLALLLPLPLSISFFNFRKLYRFFCIGLFILGIVALIMARTRMGYIGLSIGVLLSVFLYIIKTPFKVKGIGYLFLTSVVICILVISFWNVTISRFVADDKGSAAIRIPMIKLAINIIKDKPIIGVGLNNYVIVMPSYYYTKYYSILSPVHNVFLFFAAEIGIPGLLILLYFLYQAYRKIISLFKSEDLFYLSIAIGMFSGLTSLLFLGMLDLSFKNSVILWNILWLLIGLIVAIESISSSKKVTQE